jgi:hypothetical protein
MKIGVKKINRHEMCGRNMQRTGIETDKIDRTDV